MRNIKNNILCIASIVAISPLSFTQASGHSSTEEIEALKQRIEQLEGNSITKAKNGGIQIGDTTLKIGGYIKTDVHFTNNGVNGFQNGLLIPQLTATADSDGENRIDLTARESRFYINTSTPFLGTPMTTRLEVDFYGSNGTESSSNSHGLRLRHAYGSWGNWLIGQTWTTFMDLNHIPELNAFGLHASSVFVRQAQIRYTKPLGPVKLMFSIENPEDGGDDQDRPDLIARADFDGSFGHASIAVVSKELNDGAGNTTNASAYSLTARIPTFGKDDIRLQYNGGELGRYMALGTFPNVDPNSTDIQGFKSKGASIAYRHFWNANLRSSFVYSKIEADDTSATNTIDSVESIHANLMWEANPKLRFGIEYSQWEGKIQGNPGTRDFDGLQLSARYVF